jgi:hypothetical protein
VKLQLVETLDYSGAAGVQQLRLLKDALIDAFMEENWEQVRGLDQACMALMYKVNLGSKNNQLALVNDRAVLILVLRELKKVYAIMIMQCRTKVGAMAQ